jgi:hypothetical protein
MPAKLSYEQARDELTKVVATLEAGGTTLEGIFEVVGAGRGASGDLPRMA